MVGTASRRFIRFLGIAAELALVVGVLMSIRALLAFSEIAETSPTEFLSSPIWWVVFWSSLRFSTGIASLVIKNPKLWLLPILTGIGELKIFAGVLATTTNAMSTYLDLFGGFDPAMSFAFLGHFWIACLAPVFLVPILGLQSLWLFSESDRRHAA